MLSPCEIKEEDIGGRVKVGGLIEFVDQSAPDGWYADLERDRCRVGIWIPKESLDIWRPATPDAGVYLELEESGCYKRIWVEKRFFQDWTGTEQNLLNVGNNISVSGIYTEVRGEPTIDVSEPPIMK